MALRTPALAPRAEVGENRRPGRSHCAQIRSLIDAQRASAGSYGKRFRSGILTEVFLAASSGSSRKRRRSRSDLRPLHWRIRAFLWRQIRRGARAAWRWVSRAWRRMDTFHRLLAIGTVLFFVVISYLTSATDPRLPSKNVCEMFTKRPSWFVHADRAEKHWGARKSLLMAFIRHESGFRSKVRPPRRKILWIFPGPRLSTAYGYSQALDSTWREYQLRRRRPRARRDRFSDAVDFVGWYARELSAGTGIPMTDSYKLYLAYHEGPGGYAQGRHRNKPGVLAAAARVAKTAALYERQLQECAPRLKRRQMGFLALEILLLAGIAAALGLLLKKRLAPKRP